MSDKTEWTPEQVKDLILEQEYDQATLDDLEQFVRRLADEKRYFFLAGPKVTLGQAKTEYLKVWDDACDYLEIPRGSNPGTIPVAYCHIDELFEKQMRYMVMAGEACVWTIHTSYIEEGEAKKSVKIESKGFNPDWIAELSATPFRLYDDDNTRYYDGVMYGPVEFAPLDDYGTPNAGCTMLFYKEGGKWKQL